ncbi:MAG: hypothetical protein AAFX55_06700 [Bacteroidota bacterium]
MNKSVIGLYGKCANPYLACTQIELKSDNTFEYYIFMDVGGENIIKGTWKKAPNNSIILNSFSQPEIAKTTYRGKINPKLKGKVKIKISDKNGELGYSNILINNGTQGAAANESGIAEFDTSVLNNITYNFLGQEETIKIENPNYNEIEILIRDLDINAIPEFLTDYKIRVKGKKLIIDSDNVFKKTSSKNKQWN